MNDMFFCILHSYNNFPLANFVFVFDIIGGNCENVSLVLRFFH